MKFDTKERARFGQKGHNLICWWNDIKDVTAESIYHTISEFDYASRSSILSIGLWKTFSDNIEIGYLIDDEDIKNIKDAYEYWVQNKNCVFLSTSEDSYMLAYLFVGNDDYKFTMRTCENLVKIINRNYIKKMVEKKIEKIRNAGNEFVV